MADRYASLKQGLVGAWIPSISGSGLLLPDLSGRGNNGSLTGMDASDWVSSQYGRALDFDGVDDFSQTNSPLATSSQQGVISAWALCRSLPIEASVYAGVFENSAINSQIYLGVLNDASVLRGLIVIRTGTVTQLIGTTEAISLNAWTHMAISGGPSNSRFFLNGREVSLNVSVGALTTVWTSSLTNDFFMVGARRFNASPTFFLDGQLDDIRIYNRALTEPEIRLLASEPGIGFKPAKKLSRFSQRFTYKPPKAKTYGVFRVKETDHANLRQGLVGAWCPSIAGSGNLLPDVSGYGNHGVLTNMAAEDWVSGQYGRALDFDGSNDLVDIGNVSLFNFGTGPFSVSLWFRAVPFAARSALLSKDDWDLGTTGLLIYSDLGAPNHIFYYSSGTTGTSFGAIADSTWHHIAISRRSTLANSTFLYLDGRLISIITDSLNYSNSRRLRIGNDDDGNRSFPGQLDNVMIFNRSLSPAEIRLLASRPGIGLRQEQHRQTFYQTNTRAQNHSLISNMF